MKIPKYIEKLIYRRERLAVELNSADLALSAWLEKNNIKVEEYDIRGGVEMIVNPYSSAQRIMKAIRRAGGRNEME